MEVVKILEHKNKKIMYLDFSICDGNHIIEVIENIKQIIKSEPLNSVLTLVNVSNLHFNMDVLNAFKEFTEHNKPYVKAGAILGVKGLQKIAHTAITKFSDRNLPVFDTMDEAMEWLVMQE